MIALILLLAFPAVYSQTAGPTTTPCTTNGYTITCGVGFYCMYYYTNTNLGTGALYSVGSATMLPGAGMTGGSNAANVAAYFTTASYPVCMPLKAPGATCTSSTQCGALFQTPRTAGSVSAAQILTAPAASTATYGYTAGANGALSSFTTACSNYRCCKSATCTTGCDSNGNCLGDTTSCAPGASTTLASKAEQGATGAVNTCSVTYFSTVAALGYATSINADGAWATDAVLCSPNFYGTPVAVNGVGTGCLPCPSGSKTQFAGATSISQCYCPADTYLDLSNAMGGGPSITSNSVTSTGTNAGTTAYVTTTSTGTLDFAKCTACPTGSNSLAFPVTTSVTTAGISACTYSAKAYANDVAIYTQQGLQYTLQQAQQALATNAFNLQGSQYGLANSSFVLQTAQYVMQTAQFALANTAFALQTSDFYLNGNWSSTQNAFNTVFRESNNGQLGTQSSIFAFVVIIVLILVFMQFFDIVMRVLTCKCIARSPKSPVTPAPSVTVTAQA